MAEVTLLDYITLAGQHSFGELINVMFKGAAQAYIVSDDTDREVRKIMALPVVEDLNAGSAVHVRHYFSDMELSPVLMDPHEALVLFGMEMFRTMPKDALACLAPAMVQEDEGYTFEWVVFR